MSLESSEMTLEEWAARDEDAGGELVDGHLVEEEVGDIVHGLVVAWLIQAFGAWPSGRGALVGGSETDFAVGPGRGRRPDAFVYLPGSSRPSRRSPARVPPSIMVEVVSPSPRDQRRDRIEKVEDYAKFGVRWYWLVDPALRSFEVLELGADGRYVHALGATEGVVESVGGCEGLRLDLDALWTEIDSLPEEDGAPEA